MKFLGCQVFIEGLISRYVIAIPALLKVSAKSKTDSFRGSSRFFMIPTQGLMLLNKRMSSTVKDLSDVSHSYLILYHNDDFKNVFAYYQCQNIPVKKSL